MIEQNSLEAFETCNFRIPPHEEGFNRYEGVLLLLNEDFHNNFETARSLIGKTSEQIALFLTYLINTKRLSSLGKVAFMNLLRLLISDCSYHHQCVDLLLVPYLASTPRPCALEAVLAQTSLRNWLVKTRHIKGWEMMKRRLAASDALEALDVSMEGGAHLASTHAKQLVNHNISLRITSNPANAMLASHTTLTAPSAQFLELHIPNIETIRKLLSATSWSDDETGELSPDPTTVELPPVVRPSDAEDQTDLEPSRKKRKENEPRVSALSSECVETAKMCQQFCAHYQKTSNLSATLSPKQIQQLATSACKLIDKLSDLSEPVERAYCLMALSLWKAADEVLVACSEQLLQVDHFRSGAVTCYCTGVVLIKCRLLKTPASRLLLKALEVLAKRCSELLIHCTVARSVQASPLTPALERAYSAVFSIEPLPVSTVQLEFLQRANRQILSKQDCDLLVYLVCCGGDTNVNCHKQFSPDLARTSAIYDALLVPFARVSSHLSAGWADAALLDQVFSNVWTLAVSGADWPPAVYTGLASTSSSQNNGREQSGAGVVECLKTLHALVLSTPILSSTTLVALCTRLEALSETALNGTDTAPISADRSKWIASVILTCVSRFGSVVTEAGMVGVVRDILKSHPSAMLAKSALAALDKLNCSR